MIKELQKVKKELENRLLDILEKAPLREEVKEKILGLEFGSVNYQILIKRLRKRNKVYPYSYHQLSANAKENGKWKTILLKSVRNDDGTLKRLAVVYNAIKRIEKTLEELKEVGEI